MSSTLGCLIAIAGNVLVSLSLNIQRLAHKKLDLKDAKDGDDTDSFNSSQEHESQDSQAPQNYLKSRWWWTGILLMTVGETGNFLAYAFAPASVVATLGTTGLIANVFFAPLILKESFRKLDLFGVIIAIAGGITVVLSAQADQPQLSPVEIVDAVSQTTFEVYLSITIFLILLLSYLSPTYGQQYIMIDLGLVALFGGFTALSTKGVSSLLSVMFYKALRYPIFWILVAILVTTAVMQVRYLNRSLAHFDSTRVIPCQFCTFTISTIVGSAILYRDFEKMDTRSITGFILGCLLTFLGVWITSYKKGSSGVDLNESPINAVQRIKRTISTAFSEQTPLLDEITPGSRPRTNRTQSSSNAQSATIINYFVAKADANRHKGSPSSAAYSVSPGLQGSLRSREASQPISLQSTSV